MSLSQITKTMGTLIFCYWWNKIPFHLRQTILKYPSPIPGFPVFEQLGTQHNRCLYLVTIFGRGANVIQIPRNCEWHPVINSHLPNTLQMLGQCLWVRVVEEWWSNATILCKTQSKTYLNPRPQTIPSRGTCGLDCSANTPNFALLFYCVDTAQHWPSC